jgi:DNA-directed RNA polymerase subunit RPC12/RpoP
MRHYNHGLKIDVAIERGSQMSTIKIVCGKCIKTFKEHHSKIRNGLSITCPACALPIVFDSNSEDLNTRKALTAARQFRLQASADLRRQ